MKVFCFGFIVYLFVLTTQPCQDMAAVFAKACDGIDKVTHVDNPSKEGGHEDLCSPLCICSCCGMSVADRQLTFLAVTYSVEVEPFLKVNGYDDPYTKDHRNSVWQPPKA